MSERRVGIHYAAYSEDTRALCRLDLPEPDDIKPELLLTDNKRRVSCTQCRRLIEETLGCDKYRK